MTKSDEVQVEASSPETVTEPPAGKPHQVVTTVWVPSGPVAKNQLISTAIESVRDAIPVVFDLDAQITDSKESTHDKVKGREYTITIKYTPRGDGTQDPVNLDKVVKGLEVPTFEGFHPGDPDFGAEAG